MLPTSTHQQLLISPLLVDPTSSASLLLVVLLVRLIPSTHIHEPSYVLRLSLGAHCWEWLQSLIYLLLHLHRITCFIAHLLELSSSSHHIWLLFRNSLFLSVIMISILLRVIVLLFLLLLLLLHLILHSVILVYLIIVRSHLLIHIHVGHRSTHIHILRGRHLHDTCLLLLLAISTFLLLLIIHLIIVICRFILVLLFLGTSISTAIARPVLITFLRLTGRMVA